jgi:hypothetical protein
MCHTFLIRKDSRVAVLDYGIPLKILNISKMEKLTHIFDIKGNFVTLK